MEFGLVTDAQRKLDDFLAFQESRLNQAGVEIRWEPGRVQTCLRWRWTRFLGIPVPVPYRRLGYASFETWYTDDDVGGFQPGNSKWIWIDEN